MCQAVEMEDFLHFKLLLKFSKQKCPYILAIALLLLHQHNPTTTQHHITRKMIT